MFCFKVLFVLSRLSIKRGRSKSLGSKSPKSHEKAVKMQFLASGIYLSRVRLGIDSQMKNAKKEAPATAGGDIISLTRHPKQRVARTERTVMKLESLGENVIKIINYRSLAFEKIFLRTFLVFL